MMRIVVKVPSMYGDHHVLRVREALLKAAGVQEVTASAARRQVALRFDESMTSADAIRQALVAAGYPPDTVAPVTEFPKRHQDGSAWHLLPDRTTATERKDREMAGDFRRY